MVYTITDDLVFTSALICVIVSFGRFTFHSPGTHDAAFFGQVLAVFSDIYADHAAVESYDA